MNALRARMAAPLAALLLCCCSSSVLAGLLGTNVSGSLTFAESGDVNWFDPASGQVPDDASPSQPHAVVTDPDIGSVEFSFQDAVHRISVDIDDTTIDIAQVPIEGVSLPGAWTIVLQMMPGAPSDLRIAGVDLLGGTFLDVWMINAALDSVTLRFGGGVILESDGLQARFALRFTSTPLAEPGMGSLMLLVGGLLSGVIITRRERRGVHAGAARNRHSPR